MFCVDKSDYLSACYTKKRFLDNSNWLLISISQIFEYFLSTGGTVSNKKAKACGTLNMSSPSSFNTVLLEKSVDQHNNVNLWTGHSVTLSYLWSS